MDDMKRIMEREKPLEERLSPKLEDRKRVAAIAAIGAVTQMHYQRRANRV